MRLSSTLSLVMAALSSAAVLAQTDDRPTQDRPAASTRPADYVFLDEVLGAKVSIQPGAEARREAAEDNDKVKRPDGEIEDLLLDCRNGAFEYAVVSFGGVLGLGDKRVAVPTRLLKWNGTTKSYDLSANEDQLKGLPAFDLKEARKRGLDNEVVVVRSSWTKLDAPGAHPERGIDTTGKDDPTKPDRTRDDPTKVADAEARRDTGVAKDPATGAQKPQGKVMTGTTFTVVPTQYIAASDVDDYPVYALGERFGKIDKCIVDRGANKLVYCVVDHGGALGVGETEYLIPHRVMTLCRDGDNQIFCVNQSVEQMKAGVKYEKPKNGVLDPDAAKRADSMR